MGMAASQVRLLQLTSRNADITGSLEHLSMQKMSLTREMRGVTSAYQEALNSKVLKWSTNSGVTYVDLSYSNLMQPSSANGYEPYLLTNESGRVIVDSGYKKYAEMISENGAAGGDYSGDTRYEILEALTGISAEEIKESEVNAEALAEAEEALAAAETNLAACTDPTEDDKTAKQFFGLADEVTCNGTTYDLTKSSSSTINLGTKDNAVSNLTSMLNSMSSNMSIYLDDDNQTAFDEAIEVVISMYETAMNSDDPTENDLITKKSGSNYYTTYEVLMETLLAAYESSGGAVTTDDDGDTQYIIHDESSSKYEKYLEELAEYQETYDNAYAAYQTALDASNSSLTAADEQQIEFYDKIFTAIADNGWVYDSQVSDTDYLNNMLQNNKYYITTMDEDSDGEYTYDSDIASNCTYVFSVNDTDAQDEAEIEYEYQKSIITQKETMIDTRMEDLETEQSAIQTMIEGIQTVENDNIERTFGTFA